MGGAPRVSKSPGLKPFLCRMGFRGLKPPANPERQRQRQEQRQGQGQEQRQEQEQRQRPIRGSFASLQDDGEKRAKARARAKAKAKAGAKATATAKAKAGAGAGAGTSRSPGGELSPALCFALGAGDAGTREYPPMSHEAAPWVGHPAGSKVRRVEGMRTSLAAVKGVALSWEDAERRRGGVVRAGVGGGDGAGGEAGGGVARRSEAGWRNNKGVSSYEPGAELAG